MSCRLSYENHGCSGQPTPPRDDLNRNSLLLSFPESPSKLHKITGEFYFRQFYIMKHHKNLTSKPVCTRTPRSKRTSKTSLNDTREVDSIRLRIRPRTHILGDFLYGVGRVLPYTRSERLVGTWKVEIETGGVATVRVYRVGARHTNGFDLLEELGNTGGVFGGPT